MTIHRWIALVMGAVLCIGCGRGDNSAEEQPRSAAACLQRIRMAAVARDPDRVFALLDLATRWSMMSIFRDMREACSLVRRHYPKGRRARALERCGAVEAAGGPERALAVLPPGKQLLRRLRAGGELKPGDGLLRFCPDKRGAFRLCGLSDALAPIKIKAARDRALVAENVNFFTGL